jgi:vacuolar-type H+-ATPase subunit H
LEIFELQKKKLKKKKKIFRAPKKKITKAGKKKASPLKTKKYKVFSSFPKIFSQIIT